MISFVFDLNLSQFDLRFQQITDHSLTKVIHPEWVLRCPFQNLAVIDQFCLFSYTYTKYVCKLIDRQIFIYIRQHGPQKINTKTHKPTRITDRHNKTQNRQKYIQTATLKRKTDRTRKIITTLNTLTRCLTKTLLHLYIHLLNTTLQLLNDYITIKLL